MQLGLGTVTFGMDYGIANNHAVPFNEVTDILAIAQSHGIDLLDTAQLYGDSESVLGKTQHTEQFKIVSKLPAIDDLDTAQVVDLAKKSLKALKVNNLHGCLLHNIDDALSQKNNKNFANLNTLKELQLVDKIGVSVYTPEQLSMVMELFPIDLVQLPLNVFDQRFLQTGILKKAKAQGIEIHVRSAFLQGLLLMEQDQIPQYFDRFKGQLNNYFDYIDKQNIDKLTAALTFINQIPEIDYAIVGCCSAQQLSSIAKANDIAKKIPSTISFDEFASTEEDLILPTHWN